MRVRWRNPHGTECDGWSGASQEPGGPEVQKRCPSTNKLAQCSASTRRPDSDTASSLRTASQCGAGPVGQASPSETHSPSRDRQPGAAAPSTRGPVVPVPAPEQDCAETVTRTPIHMETPESEQQREHSTNSPAHAEPGHREPAPSPSSSGREGAAGGAGFGTRGGASAVREC